MINNIEDTNLQDVNLFSFAHNKSLETERYAKYDYNIQRKKLSTSHIAELLI